MIKKLFNEYNLLYKKDNNITILFSYYRSLINKYSNKKDLYFKKKPLISIIIPLFNNKNEYILRSLMSIEAQTFKNIEIIYINDNNFTENDSKLFLNMLKIIDKRILLIENKKNRGILYSKSLGVKISRGKYVIVIDQDDIFLSKNLFSVLYKISERYKLDILQFKRAILFEVNKKVKFKPETKFPEYGSVITQPKLGLIGNFLNNSLGFTYNLWDKIIKRNIYLKAINFLGENLVNSKIVQKEDHIITFPLYKIAERYMRIKIDGYLYIKHKAQTTNNINSQKSSLVYDEFTFLYFLYNNTNENEKEKHIFFWHFLIIIKSLKVCIKVNNDNIKLLVFKICNFSFNSKFINKSYNKILKFCNKFKKLNTEIKHKYKIY
jgi:glycosyltransferase involved in cell wall biosynthesis